jgi:ATP-dependent DNA ligase
MARSRVANLDSPPTRKAEFIEPMECALVSRSPEGPDWTYEVKLDGYRARSPREIIERQKIRAILGMPVTR